MNVLRVGGRPSGRASCLQPRKAFIMNSFLAVGELCENDLGHESARARLVDV